MTASYNNLASRVEVTVILTTTFKGSTYLASISNLNPSTPSPVFTLQPQSQTIDEYSVATFTASASDTTSYQWKKNAANVGTGITNYSFNTSANDNGAIINVIATGSGGVTTSNNAILSVNSYLFNYDGLTQGVNLSSSIFISDTQTFEVSLTGTFSKDGIHLFSNASNDRIALTGSGGILLANITVFTMGSTNFNLLTNGSIHTFKLRRGAAGMIYFSIDSATEVSTGYTYAFAMEISRVFLKRGAATSLGSFKGLGGKVLISVAGSLVLDAKLNNKSQGANQVSAIGGNGTIANYNASGWVVI